MSKKNNKKAVNNTTITDFFKKQVVSTESNLMSTENSSTANRTYPKPSSVFYNNCLLENVQDENCINALCADDKTDLKVKILEAKKTIDQILKAQQFAAEIIKEKEEKILLLQKQIGINEYVQPSSSSSSSWQEVTANVAAKITSSNSLLFEDFVQSFTEEQLAIIRSIEKSFSADSTFILTVTRSLYANNLNDLQNITVKGRKNCTKKEIDAQTLKTITDIFSERIDSITDIDEVAKMDRKKRLNTLLNRAITNINNVNKKKLDVVSETQPKLIQ